ncbi:MAG: hypothetical protein KC933_14000 [Myxococcales bacterium]|nr:hypothetical protein [Myxococcales bacterium]MCB9645162.1 hypothetical protein [Deltaproteobacteria bacterium]
MSDTTARDPRALVRAALDDAGVKKAADALRVAREASLDEILELGRALAEASGAQARARRLGAEISGYQGREAEIPPERKALGFASSFPVRALDMGLLDPEEIFLANREKFSQVTLTIVQPIAELVEALAQLQQGGVLALRVPAAEVTGHSADTDDDTEVFIYILPREIQKIVEAARAEALRTVVAWIVAATDG